MYRLVRFKLLLLFALLQCVAPLAHAHVNGNNAGQNAHVAVFDSSWLSSHEFDTAQSSVEQHHSAVVCMPPEYRYSDLTTVQPPVIATDNIQLKGGEHTTLPITYYSQQNLPLSPCQHPCSQAPPA